MSLDYGPSQSPVSPTVFNLSSVQWNHINAVFCFGLQTCFAKDEKNIETGAFYPNFA